MEDAERDGTAPRPLESDGADGGTVTDVDDADPAVGLGEVNLFALHDGVGEWTGDGPYGGAVLGVDDLGTGSFGFYCVAHVVFRVSLVRRRNYDIV